MEYWCKRLLPTSPELLNLNSASRHNIIREACSHTYRVCLKQHVSRDRLKAPSYDFLNKLTISFLSPRRRFEGMLIAQFCVRCICRESGRI